MSPRTLEWKSGLVTIDNISLIVGSELHTFTKNQSSGTFHYRLKGVVLFRNAWSNNSRSNDAWFVDKLYLFLPVTNRLTRGKQHILHWELEKINWLNQIGLDSLPLKLQSHKIKCSFFLVMHILFHPFSHLVC